MELNKRQQELYNKLTEIYNMSRLGITCVLVEGYAGTGKTTLISYFIKDRIYKDEIAVTAPTHKAVKVLKSKILPFVPDDKKVTFNTIHSLLSLKASINENNGSIFFKRENRNIAITYDIIVVDEASMLNKELFNILIKKDVYSKKKVMLIFLGDDAQLPPVGEKESIVFCAKTQEKHKFFKIALTEIVRQAEGNPIISLASMIRRKAYIRPITNYPTTLEDKGFFYIPTNEYKICLLPFLKSKIYESNANYFKCLAYTNKLVRNINEACRNIFYDKKQAPLDKYMQGERVIALEGYTTDENNYITTNEEFFITKIIEKNCKHEMKILDKDYIFKYMLFETIIENTRLTARLLYDNESLNCALERIKKEAMLCNITGDTAEKIRYWKLYYKVKSLFINIDYAYALTVHRSQGSTYEHVFFFQNDCKYAREDEHKLKYVAITRASKSIYLFT